MTEHTCCRNCVELCSKVKVVVDDTPYYLKKVSSKEVICMFSSLPCKRITVDNSIVLTFRSVSVPFLRNDSTVLPSIFRAFYGAVKMK